MGKVRRHGKGKAAHPSTKREPVPQAAYMHRQGKGRVGEGRQWQGSNAKSWQAGMEGEGGGCVKGKDPAPCSMSIHGMVISKAEAGKWK